MAAMDHFDEVLQQVHERGYAVLPAFLQAEEIDQLKEVISFVSLHQQHRCCGPPPPAPTRRPPAAHPPPPAPVLNACRPPCFAAGGGDAV